VLAGELSLFYLDADQAVTGYVVVVTAAEVVDALVLDQAKCNRPINFFADAIKRQVDPILIVS